ncbi:hypothetical protein HWV62_9213 [Athelia sp. TMB]|nr:hypothetical protein HWV62_9213 [Athelia sp. TMB]
MDNSAYFHSTTTLNYVRALLTSGFASLHQPRDWSLAHVRSPVLRAEFERITEGLSDALDFSRTIGVETGRDSLSFEPLLMVWISSHEGLMLDYEQALTREFPIPGNTSALNSQAPKETAHYNTSAHFIWIGDRTRQIDGAHVEYFRGIRNPIGIKVGPSMEKDELIRLLDGGAQYRPVVNPDKHSGRVTLITRYGAGKVRDRLPSPFLNSCIASDRHPSREPHRRGEGLGPPRDLDLRPHARKVSFIDFPPFPPLTSASTETSSSGLKTRNFGTIISELTSCIRIHTESGSRLGGVSLEFTGELSEEGYSVTECVGGSMELSEEELGLRYQSFCDPRLNFEQSLDVAFLVSNHFKNERRGQQQGHSDVLFSSLGGKK